LIANQQVIGARDRLGYGVFLLLIRAGATKRSGPSE
jgi:hypothetical protein